MKSMQAFKERCIAEESTRIATAIIQLGQYPPEDIARICHMSPAQVQALSDSLHT